MGHIITLILDLLTRWTVPSWFSWHDCTQQREEKKCGMCKWFVLALSFQMCGCLSSAQFVLPRVWSSGYIQHGGSEKCTCNAALCTNLILICACVLASVHIWVYGRTYICIRVCYMTLVGFVQLPLQHVAWWLCGAGLVRRAAAVWQSCRLLQRKAYVSLTGQAVQGSHHSEPFIRADANRSCSC